MLIVGSEEFSGDKELRTANNKVGVMSLFFGEIIVPHILSSMEI